MEAPTSSKKRFSPRLEVMRLKALEAEHGAYRKRRLGKLGPASEVRSVKLSADEERALVERSNCVRRHE
jgi:hypothetical protein